jgi:hypothetical protein
MNTIEIMVFVAPVLAAVVALSVGLLALWLNERAERRKAR